MEKNRLLISSIAPDAAEQARKYALGMEIAEYCTAWNMDDKFSGTDAEVRAKLEGISRRALHAPFNELFPCAIDPMARRLAAERYAQAINLASRYGTDRVVIHGGYNSQMYYPVWYTEQSVIFWKDFMQKLTGNVIICLENVFEPEPAMLGDIVRGVGDSRLRMCLDVGHVNAYSDIPVMSWLEDCADIIGHFHIHNNMGDYDMHNSLNDGTIPMKELLDAADILCPDATLALEVLTAETSVYWLTENGYI